MQSAEQCRRLPIWAMRRCTLALACMSPGSAAFPQLHMSATDKRDQSGAPVLAMLDV